VGVGGWAGGHMHAPSKVHAAFGEGATIACVFAMLFLPWCCPFSYAHTPFPHTHTHYHPHHSPIHPPTPPSHAEGLYDDGYEEEADLLREPSDFATITGTSSRGRGELLLQMMDDFGVPRSGGTGGLGLRATNWMSARVG
jgi:hypothetical protein